MEGLKRSWLLDRKYGEHNKMFLSMMKHFDDKLLDFSVVRRKEKSSLLNEIC